MRPEEERCEKALLNYFSNKGVSIQIIEGQDPPDYYAIINGVRILLEVTIASPIFYEGNEIKNRISYQESIRRLCDDLNAKFVTKLKSGTSFFLEFNRPIDNFNKFGNNIFMYLEQLANDEMKLNLTKQGVYFNSETNSVKIQFCEGRPKESKKVFCKIGLDLKHSIIDSDKEIYLILNDIINKKEAKTKVIDGQIWKGEKWLAIYNAHPLVDENLYNRVFDSITANHTFSKIFVVDSNMQVTELL